MGADREFDPEAMPGWTLVRASKAMAEVFHATFAEIGLTAHEFGVLVRLERSPGASQAAMAREVYVTPQSMGPIVRRLVDSGLVLRRAPDRRGGAASLELTAAGRRLVRDAGSIVSAANSPAALGLDEASAHDLNHLLHRVRVHLERNDADQSDEP